MILILSDEKDISSDFVVEWLLKWKVPNKIMNTTSNAINKISITNETLSMSFSNGLSFDDITVTWFRRGYLVFDKEILVNENNEEIRSSVKNHLEEELITLRDFAYHLLKTKPSINHPLHYNASKLIVLEKAIRHGLKVPPTLITQQLEDVVNYKQKENDIITKNIQDVFSISLGNQRVGTSTKQVQDKDLKNHNATFQYSLFQKSISKRYELRVFYLNGKCYSAAIFSQLNESSKEDNRIQEIGKPTRIVPYQLPKKICKKIDTLMRDLQMESGSIDLIVDNNLDYFFLEVNPVGQFDYVSKQCNYHLEYEIAKELKRMHELSAS